MKLGKCCRGTKGRGLHELLQTAPLVSLAVKGSEGIVEEREHLLTQLRYLESRLFELQSDGGASYRGGNKDRKLTTEIEGKAEVLRRQIEDLDEKILADNPHVKELLKQEIQTVDPVDIQKSLSGDAALIDWIVAPEYTAAFVIWRDGFEVVRLDIQRDHLEAMIDRLVQSQDLSSGAVKEARTWYHDFSIFNEYVQASHSVYVDVLEPVLIAFNRAGFYPSTLIMIPDGTLGNVAWNSLVVKAPDEPVQSLEGFRTLDYLVDFYAIASMPSSAFYHDRVKAAHETGREESLRIRCLANPPSPAGPLKHAEKELELIRGMEGKSAVQLFPYVGMQASRERLSHGKPADVVHLICHGDFDNENPMYSRLYLAGSKESCKEEEIPEVESKEGNSAFTLSLRKPREVSLEDVEDYDGFFYARDWYQSNIEPAWMTVLSSCSVGRSGFYGLDTFGMTRGIFYAGCSWILGALSPVDDNATPELMMLFYEELSQDCSNREVSHVLQRAILELRSRFPQYGHPMFWAMWQVVGPG